MTDNIITKYPEGLAYLEENLDVMGIPRGDNTIPMRTAMVKNIIITLARQ